MSGPPNDTNVLLEPYVRTEITHLSLALCVLGFYLVTIGQFSYLLKSRMFMSSALISLCLGIAVGPIGLDWVSPWQWVNFDEEARYNLTFQITRLVIGIQVMFAGIDLPGAYLRREALSLFMLLLPIMTIAWFVSAGFVLLLFRGLTFLEALAIAACITPTDPILANTIVKGRYAEKHVPKAVKDIISAESGANDGLGYPFLFLAVFLMQRTTHGRSINESLRHWIVTTWIYQILMSCVIGAVIGYVARKTLKFAHTRQLIDHESFLAYGVGLALFTLGVVGVLGSDDVLACFIAGNSLTWRDFYRIEASEEDTFQDVIDSLLDTATFIYVGAVMPWSEFTSDYISPWRLVVFALCILVFRRLPAMLALYRFIPALDGFSEGLFAGWFGPIGVSAIYYAILARENLPEDRVAVRESVFPIVIFMAMSSTIVHGITIPATKAAPLAIKRTKSSMSYASRRGNLLTRWFRGDDDSASNVPNVPTPAHAGTPAENRTPANGTPAAGTPANASRAVSRRTSFDDAHTIREGVGAQPGTPGPITIGRTEGGDFAKSRQDAEKDAEKEFAPFAEGQADGSDQEMRELHAPRENGHRAFALSASLPRYPRLLVKAEEKLQELKQKAPCLAFDSKDAKELAVIAITHSSLSATRNNAELARVGEAYAKAVATKALFLSPGLHTGLQYNKAIAINFSSKVLAPIARSTKLEEVLRTAPNNPFMSDDMLAKALLALLGALELASGDETLLQALKELEIVKLPKPLENGLDDVQEDDKLSS